MALLLPKLKLQPIEFGPINPILLKLKRNSYWKEYRHCFYSDFHLAGSNAPKIDHTLRISSNSAIIKYRGQSESATFEARLEMLTSVKY
ncbi:hypothetical protein CEXT_539171 [Caerostris extrusa]|uniref:Uncharacterized protein n=1 Tax=Caerostris extrusa TaxID=172846 RepID=A0AAV4WQH0_CAEEX|nr:hypothetical protein CEXT_539171 [Caerostris extrusa]